MEPIRILHVLASLDRGGAETTVMNIYREIDRTKIQFDFVVNESEDEYAYESEVKVLGGNIYRLPRYNISNYLSYKVAWKLLLKEHPEWKIIHGHHTTPAFIYLSVANSLNRLSIAHSHTAGAETGAKSLLKILFRYSIRFIADYLFACSKPAANWMFGKKYSQSTLIINNAIDPKKYTFNESTRKEKRKEFGIQNKFVIGHVGRFDTAKNQGFLIDVFKLLYDENDNTVLMLAGDGELRLAVENKVNDLGLKDNVIFTGVRSDISDLMQAMDVFVFPSLYEGLPVTVIEAQSAGLPCIISDTITDEVSVTSLVKFLSIKTDIGSWVNEIFKYNTEFIRQNTEDEIYNAGYDVNESSKWLQDFYIKNFNVLN